MTTSILDRCALGTRGMLLQAMLEHRKQFARMMPRAFRLHPEVWGAFLRKMKNGQMSEVDLNPNNPRSWLGIRIIVSDKCRFPKMVRIDGEIVEL